MAHRPTITDGFVPFRGYRTRYRVVGDRGTSDGVPIRAYGDGRARPLVEMRGITKRFGSVVANDAVSLTIREGEIQSVLGENGAGKTTLMNVLAGMYRADEGTIRVRGEEAVPATPHDALRLGIGTVYQHFTLVPNLSVVENVILGTDAGFVLRLSEAERRVGEMLGGFGMEISPRTEVRHLSLGQQQQVEILKVLYRGSRVLLLDEPTSVLTPVEVAGLFEVLMRLRAEGVAVVLITHKLEEALEGSDRITVLRQGRKLGELGPEQLAATERAVLKQRVVDLMFGGLPPQERASDLDATVSTVQRDAAPVLSLRNVSAKGNRGDGVIHGVSLDLNAGEVFGIAGVDGNGQKELGEVIAGQRATTDGQVLLDGANLTNRGVAVAAKAGVGYVTDDRLGEGCVAAASVAENLVLKSIGDPPFANGSVLDWGAIEAHARELIREFDVRTPSPWTRISLLSGGNIQKLLLARELSARPKLLVCNKPTNGLDVKTARFILRTLRERADAGMTVLLISSELDEILEISDRIGVMYNGRLVASFARDGVDPETIGRLMLGVGVGVGVANAERTA